jgi:poly(3-hydroxybutyrate) depolymerase
MSLNKEDHIVGGLKISVYKPLITTSSVAVLFLLHGRHGSAAHVDGIARVLAEKTSSSTQDRRTILIVTLVGRVY